MLSYIPGEQGLSHDLYLFGYIGTYLVSAAIEIKDLSVPKAVGRVPIDPEGKG